MEDEEEEIDNLHIPDNDKSIDKSEIDGDDSYEEEKEDDLPKLS